MDQITNWKYLKAIYRNPIEVIPNYKNKMNRNLTYITKRGRRVSWLARTGFAAFGKGVQLKSGPLYDETK